MGDVITNFLQPIARQFQMPKGAATDPEAWQRDYIEAMEAHTDSLLALAAKRVIKTRDSRSFPLVAECVKACQDALADVAMTVSPKASEGRHRQGHHDDWDDARIKRADHLIQSNIGITAAKEGWLLSLWDFCRKEERWPNRLESEKMCSEFKKRVQETNEYFNKELAAGRPMMKTVKGYFASREARQSRLMHLVGKYRDNNN
jgi:hypothetical protein